MPILGHHWQLPPPPGTGLNTTHPLSRGLVGFWPFHECGGRLVTDLAGLYRGSAQAAPQWDVLPAPHGPSLRMDGSAQWVSVAASPDFVPADLSVSVWFRMSSTSGQQGLVDRLNTSSPWHGWSFKYGYPTPAALNFYNDGTGWCGTANLSLQADTWYHAVLTAASGSIAAGRVNFYLNGKLLYAATAGYLPSYSAQPLRFGRSYDGTYLNGYLSKVGVWSRVLGADEVRTLHMEPWVLAQAPSLRRTWNPSAIPSDSMITSASCAASASCVLSCDAALAGRADVTAVIGIGTLSGGTPAGTVPLKFRVMPSGTSLMVEPDTAAPQPSFTGLDTSGPAAGAVTYLGTDTVTGGNWVGAYGADGYELVGVGSIVPSYVLAFRESAGFYVWAASSTEARCLQDGAGGRLAAIWYSGSSGHFSYVTNFQDGAVHTIHFYSLDWDNASRVMRIDVTDSVTGVALDTRTVSSFSQGVWFGWTVAGNVRFTFSNTAGTNAVVSGVFFDGGGSAPPAPLKLLYRKNGGPTVGLSNPFYNGAAEGLMPYMVYAMLEHIAAADSVTVYADDGALTTSSGLTAPVAGVPAENHSGGRVLPNPLSGPRPMRVGYQGEPGAPSRPPPMYANLMKTAFIDWNEPLPSQTLGPLIRGVTTDGYPVNETNAVSKLISNPATDDIIQGVYEYAVSPGRYTLLWDGTADAYLLAFVGGVVTEVVSLRNITGTVNNRRVYDCTRSDSYKGASINLLVSTSGNRPISNLRLFDPFVSDVYNPPYFHPKSLAQLRGVRVLRMKDYLGLDSGCSIAEFDDIPKESWVTYRASRSSDTIKLLSISAYAPYQQWTRDGTYAVELTFASPHNFKAGQWVNVYAMHATDPLSITRTFTYTDATTHTSALWGLVYPVAGDPNSVVMLGLIDNKQIVTQDTSAESLYSYMPLRQCTAADLFKLPVAVGDDCRPWVAMPHASTDDLAYRLGQTGAANVPDSRVVYVEYTNEPWNTAPGFPQASHLATMGREFAQTRAAAGDNSWVNSLSAAGVWYYVLRTAQLFEQFKAGWVAGGKNPANLRMVLNCQLANAGLTTSYLNFANTHDVQGRPSTDPSFSGRIVPHLLAFAPYLPIGPSNTTVPVQAYDSLTVGQACDLADAFMLKYAYSAPATWMGWQKSAIAVSPYPGVAVGSYEGGPAYLAFGGTQSRMDALTVAWSLHPRLRAQFQTQLRYYQNQGYETYIKLGPGGVYAREGGAVKAYACFLGVEQVAGNGDGSDGLTDNRPLLAGPDGMPLKINPSSVVSTGGRSVNEWNAPTPSPSAPGRLVLSGGGATVVFRNS